MWFFRRVITMSLNQHFSVLAGRLENNKALATVFKVSITYLVVNVRTV